MHTYSRGVGAYNTQYAIHSGHLQNAAESVGITILLSKQTKHDTERIHYMYSNTECRHFYIFND